MGRGGDEVRVQPAGRTVLGFTLVILGGSLVVSSAGYTSSWAYLRTYWPVLIAALGVEIILRQWWADRSQGPVRVVVDGPSVAALLVIVVILHLHQVPPITPRVPTIPPLPRFLRWR